MGHRHLERRALEPIPVGHQVLEDVRYRADLVDGQLGIADAFEAAHRHDVAVLVDGLQLAAGHQLEHGPQGGLHDAAGGAEDQARAGGAAEGSSKSDLGMVGTSRPAWWNILPSSRVVRPKSTSL